MKSALAWMLVLGAAAGASAQSFEDYRYFLMDGIFDPGLSDETASALVRKGIASEDPAIRRLTIKALAWYVMYVVRDAPTEYGPTPERSFSVPDLKSFLIGYWREQHRRSGYDTVAALRAALGARVREEADGSIVVERNSHYRELPAASLEDVVWYASPGLPVWIAIPQILCALYPGDGDVLELVWERENKDVSIPSTPIGTLRLLNLGGFATPEADAFRIDALVEPGGILADEAVSLAAEGLALSRPVEAVPHLVSVASEHPEASEDVLLALTGYGDDVLSDHASEIAGMLAKVERPPMGTVANAVSRLEAFGRRQRDAELR